MLQKEETLGQKLFESAPSNFGQGMQPQPGPKDEPKITIEIRPGRWGKIFHLFDGYGGEIKLQQKEALKLARTILKEQNK